MTNSQNELWSRAGEEFQQNLAKSWGQAMQTFQTMDLGGIVPPAQDAVPQLTFSQEKLKELQAAYLEEATALWNLGLDLTGTYKSDRENVDEDICAMGVGPFKVEVDLMQPLDLDKKPAVHNTPLNHVGLWIDNLPVAVEWLSQQGVRFAPGGIRKGAAGFDICFIHPKGSEELPIGGEGVLIELVQAPDEVVKAFSALAAQYA